MRVSSRDGFGGLVAWNRGVVTVGSPRLECCSMLPTTNANVMSTRNAVRSASLLAVLSFALLTLAGCSRGVPADASNQPPSAAAGDDGTVQLGEALTFDASESADADGDIVAFTWDFGDGGGASGPVVEHAYDRVGVFTVTLTVEDDDGAVAVDELIITVLPRESDSFSLVISVSPSEGGIVQVDPPGESHPPGTRIRLRATANAGFRFSAYSGDVSSDQSEILITLTADLTVTAEFDPLVPIQVVASPEGAGVIDLNPSGESHPPGTLMTITAQPADGFVLDSFVDADGREVSRVSPLVFTLVQATFFTAVFVPGSADLFSLSALVNPPEGGSVMLDPPGPLYASGTTVTVQATATEDFRFVRFSGDATGLSNSVQIVMDANKQIVAEFEPSLAHLTVVAEPGDGGEVTLDPPGGVYEPGAVVRISAITAEDFYFEGYFREDGTLFFDLPTISFTVVSDVSLTARFAEKATLAVTLIPLDGGSVELDPPGGRYVPGTRVTLTAAANRRYRFVRYSGDLESTHPVQTLVIEQDTSVHAEFNFTMEIGEAGNILIGGFSASNVTEFHAPTGTRLEELVVSGTGGLLFAGGLDFDSTGDLHVVSVVTGEVLVYSGTDGAFLGRFIGATDRTLFALRFGPDGDLYLPDNTDDSVVRYDGRTGEDLGSFVGPGAGGLDQPLGLLFHPISGNLLVVSKGNDRLIEYDGGTGVPVGTFADLSAIDATLPIDAVATIGGDVLVTISGNDSVALVNHPARGVSTFVSSGAGGLTAPGGLAIHPDSGNLLVVD